MHSEPLVCDLQGGRMLSLFWLS